jgi:cytochrome c-type biogenesis protein CcmH
MPTSAPATGTTLRRRLAALAAIVVLPIGAAAVYLSLGSPLLPSQPQAVRLELPPEQRSITDLVARVEAHLEQNPDDGRGWEVLAPVYMRLGRYDDAVKARRNVLRLSGVSAEREADLGEALTGVANGVVTAEAKAAFDRALKIDPNEFKARYYAGLAAEQDGRTAEARDLWRSLLAGAPAEAPWIGFVRESLARVDPGTPPPGPSTADIAAAGELSPEQRAEMVRGMVERLAARLQNEGSDVDGWLRLLRAYMVLGDRDKARAAATDARRALASEPDKLRRVEELIKGLGLEG